MHRQIRPRNVRAALACWLLVGAAIGGIGCGEKSVRSWTFETSDTTPVRLTEPAIDVENFRGDVTVRINPNAEGITVWREIRVTGEATKEEKQIAVEDSPCHVDLEERDGLPVLMVRSLSALPDHKGHDARLTIIAPTCGGVRIVNGKGEVVLVGVSGAIHVENERGNIEVRTNHALTDPVALTTRKGDVYVQGPFASSGAIDVDAGDGRAVFEAPDRASTIKNHSARGGRYTVVYNDGANPMLIRTGDGTAAVMFIKNPQDRVRAFR